jgi:hypothetical protein
MTSSEFSSWLKGFADAVGSKITPFQLEILKAKIGEVNFQPTYPVIPVNPPYWPQNPFYVGDPPNWMQFPITVSAGTGNNVIYRTTTNSSNK